MEKERKVVHINDGSKKILAHGEAYDAEEFVWAGEVLSTYVNAGFQVVSMMTDYTPCPGQNSFFKTGFHVILEREIRPDNIEIPEIDWQGLEQEPNTGENAQEEKKPGIVELVDGIGRLVGEEGEKSEIIKLVDEMGKLVEEDNEDMFFQECENEDEYPYARKFLRQQKELREGRRRIKESLETLKQLLQSD